MPSLAYFGIESKGLNLVVDLLILFVVVLYLSLIYWTYNDARRRIADPMLVGCALAASLFPFVGTVIYMILRPPEYLEDARERELEMQAAELRLRELQQTLCPHCDHTIERDFVRCPSCLRKLKERCVSCQRPLDQAWTICPYCEAEVPGAIAPARRRRSRRSAVEGEPVARVSEDGSPGRGSSREGGSSRERDSVAFDSRSTEVDMPAVAASPVEEQTERAQPVAAPESLPPRSRAAPRAPHPRTSS
jgi:Double zinc ribbon